MWINIFKHIKNDIKTLSRKVLSTWISPHLSQLTEKQKLDFYQMYLSTQRLLAKSDLFTKAFLKIVDQFPLLIIWSQSQVLCSKQRHTHHNNRTSHTQKKSKSRRSFLAKKKNYQRKSTVTWLSSTTVLKRSRRRGRLKHR